MAHTWIRLVERDGFTCVGDSFEICLLGDCYSNTAVWREVAGLSEAASRNFCVVDWEARYAANDYSVIDWEACYAA